MNAQAQMFELVDVTRVEPRGGYRVEVAFSDDTEGGRDFADMIVEGGEMVEPLRGPAFSPVSFLTTAFWPGRTASTSTQSHSICR